MRRFLIAVIVGLFVVIPMSAPVAAAPAQPYSFSSCDSYTTEDGNVYETCASFKGVYQSVEMPNGMSKFTDNGRSSSSEYLNGEFYASSEFRWNRGGLIKYGGVFHEVARGSHSLAVAPGEIVTCIVETNFVYAHFEVRHSVSIVSCA